MNALSIAAACGVSRRTVDRWAHRSDFPKRAGRIETAPGMFGNAYDWDAVKTWLIETDRWDDVIDRPSGFYLRSDGRSQPKRGSRS